MSPHLQRLARGIPRVARAIADLAEREPFVLALLILFALLATPIAGLAFFVAAYLLGE